jgi:hypothetical protein
MDVLEFNRRLMQIEEDLALFPDTRVADPGWWDVVRHDVMKLVYAQITGGAPDALTVPGFGKRLHHLVVRLLLRVDLELRLRLMRHDVLVYRAPRLLREGRRIDTGLDQILSVCPGRHLVINTFPHRYDRGYARAGDLAARPAQLDALEHRLRDEFGFAVDLDAFVRQRLADFQIGARHYARLLARVKPRLILLTQNGVDKALFHAARRAGVTCIEAQHGLISSAHPAYAYPASVSGTGGALFPDGLLAFSHFWIQNCHYPVRWSVATGNDLFVPSTSPLPTAHGEVLVITAAKYNERLCVWTEGIAARMPGRVFKFKLHPSQGHQKAEVQARFCGLPNVEVIGTDRTTSHLLSAASDVLLIQSTVAYEAVQSGRRLLVIDEMDSGTHADLLPLPNVHLVRHLDELVRTLHAPAVRAESPVFFQRFDAETTRVVLASGQPVTRVAASTLTESRP